MVAFAVGELTDLCVPHEGHLAQWARWFNDRATTRWLEQGVFPNDEEKQRNFLEGIRRGERLALMICGKNGALYGTISLSSINLVARSAQIAIVIGERLPPGRPLQLEAMALLTEHGFERMGLNRISAGQAFPALRRWGEWLELIGYRTEGIHREGFAKGREVSDTVSIACLYEDYARLVKRRGRLWPGATAMKMLIRHHRQGLAPELAAAIRRAQEDHFGAMDRLELAVMAEQRRSPDSPKPRARSLTSEHAKVVR